MSARTSGTTASDTDRRYWAERLAGRGEPLRLPYDGDPDAPRRARFCSTTARSTRHSPPAWSDWPPRTRYPCSTCCSRRTCAAWRGGRAPGHRGQRRPRPARGTLRRAGPACRSTRRHPSAAVRHGPDEPVVALAQRLRRIWLESEQHSGLSSLDLAGLLPGGGPRTASPAGFSFARFPARAAADYPVEVRAEAAGTGSAATRLSLLCWADQSTLRMSWNFPSALFEPRTVARLDKEYREELAALCALRNSPRPLPFWRM
ncbi:hypothetical protein NKH18_32020 [Streptomyces sp. M10(2022)]